jgi:hypothetical protein
MKNNKGILGIFLILILISYFEFFDNSNLKTHMVQVMMVCILNLIIKTMNMMIGVLRIMRE